MKKIFVTVEEFFKNGGELALERPLFKIHDQGYGYEQIGEFKGLHTLDGEMIIVQEARKSYPIYSFIAHVEIEVTPIWK